MCLSTVSKENTEESEAASLPVSLTLLLSGAGLLSGADSLSGARALSGVGALVLLGWSDAPR